MSQTYPKAQATSIADAFQQALPNLPPGPSIGSTTHISSLTVMNATPPKFWLDLTARHFVNKAEQALAASHVRRETIEKCVPSVERSIMLSSEADVVRAAALYLLHPVNTALSAALHNVQIVCLSESSGTNTRPDIVYLKGSKPVAVLEYKIAGVIQPGEFEDAKVSLQAKAADVQQLRGEAEEAEDRTYFGRQATKMVKQMTAYSESTRWNTKYVGLFNWNYLFLSVFNRDSEIIHGSFIGDAERLLLRKALLGWLLEAYENDGQSSYVAPDAAPEPAAGGKSSGSRGFRKMFRRSHKDED